MMGVWHGHSPDTIFLKIPCWPSSIFIGRKKLAAVQRMALCFKAWNDWIAGHSAKKYTTFEKGAEFPMPNKPCSSCSSRR